MDPIDQLDLLQLVARYIHIIDDGAWERLDELFTVDGTCDFRSYGLPLLEGCDAIQEYFTTFSHPLAHHAVNTLIEPGADPDQAVLRSKMILAMHGGAMWCGEYRDRVVRTADGWRFADRTAVRPRTLKTKATVE